MTPRASRWGVTLLALIALAVAGCAPSERGDDTIAQNAVNSAAERGVLDCEVCHSAANEFDPLVLNGSGTAGKHVAHVSTKGYDCEECHATYRTAETHFDGTLDADDPLVDLVQFGTLNPDASWTGDTGAGAGTCANAYCHGSDNTPAWYAVQPLDCTSCHSTGSPIDPLVTGGTGLAGQHQRHVTTMGLSCETCHGSYSAAAAHVNGSEDADTSASLVSFAAATNPTNPDGVWAGDTGAGTGSCADTYCHGGQDGPGTSTGPSWYTTTFMGCKACHVSTVNSALDPLAIDGTGLTGDGKHNTHVTTRGIPCTTCHADYLTRATHIANKTFDPGHKTGDPANSADDLVTIAAGASSIVTWDAATNTCSAAAGCHDIADPYDWYQ